MAGTPGGQGPGCGTVWRGGVSFLASYLGNPIQVNFPTEQHRCPPPALPPGPQGREGVASEGSRSLDLGWFLSLLAPGFPNRPEARLAPPWSRPFQQGPQEAAGAGAHPVLAAPFLLPW